MSSEREIYPTNSIQTCQNCKKDFTIEPDDFGFYEKIKVPPPTFCFECRLQRKMSRRNERSLYKRKCDLCSLDIISIYPEKTSFPVFCPKCWWGDGWDSLSYGKEYDFTKTFFEQWKEFSLVVPRIALYQKNPINSPYSNHVEDVKNSYLVINCAYTEDVFYGKWILYSKNVVDAYSAWNSELGYELIEDKKCFNSSFLTLSKNCIDCAYLYDCHDCINCFLSSNLRNKKYFFKNKPLSKEDYEKTVSEFIGSYTGQKKALEIFKNDILLHTPRKYIISGKQTNSTGDYLFSGSKNLKYCFRVSQSEDSAYCVDSADLKDCYDTYESALTGCEQQYEFHAGNHTSHSKFCSICYSSHDIEYCEMCHDSEYLFGCIALRKKKYCIFNKQYSKEEYENLIPKIIKHMNDVPYVDKVSRIYKYGEFFPVELSLFNYNETVAQEYFPLNKDKALKEGYGWKEKIERKYKIDFKSKDIPDNIMDIEENIVGKVIECLHNENHNHNNTHCDETCTEVFKIVPEEFAFYKRMNISIPRLCPNCRHYVRQKQMNPMKLYHRSCVCV